MSCGNAKQETEISTVVENHQKPAISISEDIVELTIHDRSVQEISPGDKIQDHVAILEKSTLSTGEGDFEIFRVMNEEIGVIGNIYPDPLNEALVGIIAVTSEIPKTKIGIHVGSTYGDLKSAYNDIEVHGSEIEGRTFANVGNLSFRLSINHYSYVLDESKIPLDTPIEEIHINR